eukprot:3400818-Amphidinium_carterae.2
MNKESCTPTNIELTEAEISLFILGDIPIETILYIYVYNNTTSGVNANNLNYEMRIWWEEIASIFAHATEMGRIGKQQAPTL